MSTATLVEDFVTRIQTGLYRRSLFGQMASWMEENVILNGGPFSFKDHEFQIQIANETRSMVVKKLAQVGLSQISVQKAVGYVSLARGKHLIYVLPTAVFAKTFSKSRIAPLIKQSPKIFGRLNVAVSSVELKEIGTSFLHMGGAQAIEQVISVPAEAVVIDEYNFCDPDTVTAYESRLGHAENDGITSKFSTPTLPDFGVSKEIKSSTWARYLVKCPQCYSEVAPIFSEHVRIPGFDKPFNEFDRDVLESGQCQVDLAFISCPKCGGSLDKAFRETSRRWVEQFPDRTVAGYDVRPFDLIKYNPTSKVLAKISKYKTRQNYYNFALGEEYLSADAQIIPALVEQHTVLTLADTARVSEMCMGVDVGKVCHVMIGTKRQGIMLVRRCLRLYESDGPLKEQILELVRKEGVVSLVIDAAPDFTLSRGTCDDFPTGFAFPAYYTEQGEKNMTFWAINEKQQHINLNHSKTCQEWVERVNGGKVNWTQSDEMELVKLHLTQMKRMQEMSGEGALEEGAFKWVKASGTDHYFHAGNYLMTAIDLINANAGSVLPATPIMLTAIKVGWEKEGDQRSVAAKLRERALG